MTTTLHIHVVLVKHKKSKFNDQEPRYHENTKLQDPAPPKIQLNSFFIEHSMLMTDIIQVEHTLL